MCIENNVSQLFHLDNKVPQGSVLSESLFLMFINGCPVHSIYDRKLPYKLLPDYLQMCVHFAA